MNGKHISLIYFYVISAGSLVLIVIGIFNSVNFLINATQYDQYPLRYSNGSCEVYPNKFGGAPVPAMYSQGGEATPSAQELQQQKDECLRQEELDRKQHKIEDLRSAITFTLVGLVLFLIHFPQARKQSQA